MCKQIIIVQAETAEKFQEFFNSKLRELEGKDPQIEFNHGQGFCAYIIYSDNSCLRGVVRANVTICDSCLRLCEPPRPHAKWRKCELFGSVTRKDCNCEHYIPGGDLLDFEH